MIQNWNSGHAAETRAFLNTATGKLFLEGLNEVADAVPYGETIEQEALNSRERRGGYKVIKAALAAANYQEPAAPIEREDIDIEERMRDALS